MKKLLGIIIVLGLLVFFARVWQAQFCKDVVKESSLTGFEAKVKYEECLKW